MKKTLTAVALTAAAFASQAQGFYVGAGVGFSKVDNELDKFNSGMVAAVGGSIASTQDTSVRNLRLLGGYKVNENLAVELGYLNSSKLDLNFSGTSGGSVAYSGNGNISFSGFDVSAVLRPSIASGYNNFFATVGVHNYKAKVGVNFAVGSTNIATTQSQSGTGVMFGAGYDWKIDKDIDLRLAVTRVNKLAGESGNSITNYGVGLIKHF
jgi:OOP family OmpA-OmpF porin